MDDVIQLRFIKRCWDVWIALLCLKIKRIGENFEHESKIWVKQRVDKY